MSWWGKLFGTEKAVDSLLDKDKGMLVRAGKWINDMQYTDAEREQNNLIVKEWGIKQLEALLPFKVVQRVLAFLVIGFWVIVGANVLVALWVEALSVPKECAAGMICQGIQIKKDMMDFAMSQYVLWPSLTVLALYFTGGVLPSKTRS